MTNNKQTHVLNDQEFEKNWSSLIDRIDQFSKDEIAWMDKIDPHGRIMLLSIKKWLMTRVIEGELQSPKKEGI
jgi:hypothetical protein